MTRVDGTTQLAEIIRQQVSSLRKPGRTLTPNAASNGRPTQKNSRRETRDIASLVAQRVQVIDPDDPQREHKAFQIFLESVLLAEIGEDLMNDPTFYQMVEQIQRQIETDPLLAPLVHRAATILLTKSHPSTGTI